MDNLPFHMASSLHRLCFIFKNDNKQSKGRQGNVYCFCLQYTYVYTPHDNLFQTAYSTLIDIKQKYSPLVKKRIAAHPENMLLHFIAKTFSPYYWNLKLATVFSF